MGRISSEPQKETPTPITHFSHPHPLKLITHNPQLQTPLCSGCKLNPSGLIYSCTICSFVLHKKCFEMPKSITHPCHKDHSFTLLPKPAYPDGLFNCDACGEVGSGFSYNCKPCGIDLHILCAVMPVSLSHSTHPHKLSLTYGCPYSTKIFSCHICKNNGSDHWLYRCNSCGFDAHLNCARALQPPILQNNVNITAFQSQGHPAGTSNRSAPQPQQVAGFRPQFPAGPLPPRPMQQIGFMPQPMMNINQGVGIPVAGGAFNNPQMDFNRQVELQTLAIQQMIMNNNQMAMRALLAGGAGGFGAGLGGGNNSAREFQQLMQMMYGLNNNASGGGIGIGGGGIPGLNGFGGGGGGGIQDILQGLMGGGGGGGIDLQSLLGGGNGLDLLGGGGLDFLGGLGGFGF